MGSPNESGLILDGGVPHPALPRRWGRVARGTGRRAQADGLQILHSLGAGNGVIPQHRRASRRFHDGQEALIATGAPVPFPLLPPLPFFPPNEPPPLLHL